MLVNTQNFSVRRFAPSFSGLAFCTSVSWSSLPGIAMSGLWLFVVRFCQVLHFGLDQRRLVTLRQARLAPGWVIVLGRVNHLGAEPGNQVHST